MKLLKAVTLAAAASSVAAKTYLKEDFSGDWEQRWVVSDWKKDEDQAGSWSVTAGESYGGEEEAAKGLKTMDDARFYAISTAFPEFDNTKSDLVVQFSVKHEQGIDCGGGYMKLFPKGVDQKKLHGGEGEDVYNIMFGPDICGYTKRTHVIFNYKEKNHLIENEVRCESDELTHVYTLVVKPDRTFEVFIDGKSERAGSLVEEFKFLEAKEIKDPAQSKPADWVDEPRMADPADVKPEGYDEIKEQIVDPEATKPEDWDDEDDGEWEAPMIANPEFKGPWSPKMIDNPEYKGEWEHPVIANPAFVDDETIAKYTSFGVAAFEVWQVKAGTIFDNVIITDDIKEADALREATFEKIKDEEKEKSDAAAAAKREADEEAAKSAQEDEEEMDEEEDFEDEEEPKDEL